VARPTIQPDSPRSLAAAAAIQLDRQDGLFLSPGSPASTGQHGEPVELTKMIPADGSSGGRLNWHVTPLDLFHLM
jgi:hypothetical protein